jgi:hypothetical protein
MIRDFVQLGRARDNQSMKKKKKEKKERNE